MPRRDTNRQTDGHTATLNSQRLRRKKLTVDVDVILYDKNDAAIGQRSSAAVQQTSGVKQTTPGNVDTVHGNDSISSTNRSLSKQSINETDIAPTIVDKSDTTTLNGFIARRGKMITMTLLQWDIYLFIYIFF